MTRAAAPPVPAARGRALSLGLLLVLLAVAAWALVNGQVTLKLPTLQAWARHDVPLAACATLASLLVAAPLALAGVEAGWLLLPWVVLVAGLHVLPLPAGPAARIAHATVLALPLMLLMLQGAWSTLPAGLSRTAAAAGAPFASRLALRLRLATPGAVRACVVVGLLCVALVGRQSAAP